MRWLTKLSAAQRIDMVEKGLNPLDEQEVGKYLNGEGLSLQEKNERIKILTGGRSMGSSQEREVNADTLVGREFNEKIEASLKQNKPSQQDFRKSLQEEFNKSSSNVGKVLNTDDILSLKKTTNNKQMNTNNVIQEGYENTKNYLNAFTINLQSANLQTSYQLRLNLFKALKICLESENKYKDNLELLKQYRSGVLKAEKALLDKL